MFFILLFKTDSKIATLYDEQLDEEVDEEIEAKIKVFFLLRRT